MYTNILHKTFRVTFLLLFSTLIAISCDGSGGGESNNRNSTNCIDNDNDSFFSQSGCGTAVDCDDSNDNINPGVAEACGDGIDNDCDNTTDCSDDDCAGDLACQTCTDSDSDTYYVESGCGTAVDCDDSNENINSGATEACDDGIDNDCDNTTDCSDDDCAGDIVCQTCTDSDSDTYYVESGCGTVVDCNDGNDTIYSGAMEICDGVDNQCPGDIGYGIVDEGCTIPSGMALIPSGCFDMGDTFNDGNSDELPVHNVCFTSSFYMDVHEVTNAEYAACVNVGSCTSPLFSNSYTRRSYYGNPFYDGFPVIYVSWDQAKDYCTWSGKRLITEAEWEYAARGGLSDRRYPWGDTINGTDTNYGDSLDPWDNDTSPVEYYAANGYGLYDMAGNVQEWVSDWYQSDYYNVSPPSDPPGPPSADEYRVLRGGSWYFLAASDQRVAARYFKTPPLQALYIGIRCAAD